jgi:hypothetical protein
MSKPAASRKTLFFSRSFDCCVLRPRSYIVPVGLQLGPFDRIASARFALISFHEVLKWPLAADTARPAPASGVISAVASF